MKWFRPWWLLILIPIFFGVARLRFDAEVLDLLPGNVPAVHGLKIYQQHFTNARELIVTVQAENADDAKSAAQSIAEKLRAETNLISTVTWQPPWLEHPEQTAELIAYLWLNQPPEIFQQLAARLAETNLDTVLAATRDELSATLSPNELAQLGYDPLGLTRLPQKISGASFDGQGDQIFSSADGTFRIIFIQSRTDLKGYRECTDWFATIKNSVQAALPAGKKIAVNFTGRPAFVTEISASMKHDIVFSVTGTALIIAILFYIAHRRLKPMLWLLTLLALILAATLALGGLIFGTVSVVSMGFAAILLGLAVDYAVVHYQEALAQPELSIPQVRRAIAPAIFWAAVTTISAFVVLNFGGLPGLAQLGSLVGIGVALAAFVMIFAFLPPLFPQRMMPQNPSPRPSPLHGEGERVSEGRVRGKIILAATAILILFCAAVLWRGLPTMDATANVVQPRDSQAYAALEAIKIHLSQSREPLSLIVAGQDENAVAQKLAIIEPLLESAVSNGVLASFNSPNALWPRPDFQTQNRAAARQLVFERAAFHSAAATNGFAESSLGLADEILSTWQRATMNEKVFWPTNPLATWIFEKVAVRETNQFFAAAFLFPSTNAAPNSFLELEAQLPRDGVWLSSWELLGGTVLAEVKRNLWKLLLPMISLVLLSLWLAFRRFQEILLSIGVLFLSGLCLLSVMKTFGWQWNLLNLMALPLVLGTGVDYSIFMQLALRRHGGDLAMAHRSVGRALLLCGGTAIAGFGSLGFSSNLGMASLGRVCAVGIAANMIFSIFLLPAWWKFFDGEVDSAAPKKFQPSQLYQAKMWRLGLLFARLLPNWFCALLGDVSAIIYWLAAPHRRKIVTENLLPVLNGDRAAAKRSARELFRQFALKLVDLWRYESGALQPRWFGDWHGWEHFAKAEARGRGVLLVTPHLGNWEFGGAFLVKKGFKLLVLTQPEPDAGLTEMRQKSRALHGVETLVVGEDAFAFLEIIKRLQAGASVALLLDRPPAPTAVDIELFGEKFPASIAAAELARASGCAILPGYIVREADGYYAQMLPEIVYDRAAIGNRVARVELTQQILRALEPAIRQHHTQWFHFVPVWPEKKFAMKKLFVLTLCILFTLQKISAADTNAVLENWFAAQSKVQTWSAEFTQTRTLKTLTQPLVANGHLDFAAPDNFRWALGSPARTIALGKSTEMFVIYPLLKRAEHYPLGPGTPKQWRDTMSLLQAGFPRSRKEFEAQFQMLSLMETNGAWRLALQPRSEFARQMMPELRIGLQTNDYLLASTEMVFVDGSTMRNDFTNGVINPPLEKNVFEWTPPAGFKVTEPFKQ